MKIDREAADKIFELIRECDKASQELITALRAMVEEPEWIPAVGDWVDFERSQSWQVVEAETFGVITIRHCQYNHTRIVRKEECKFLRTGTVS